jgi:hypothetical protein
MIAFSKEEGFAEDIGDIWRSKVGSDDSEQEDPIEVRVRIDICDDNELGFNWKEGKTNTTLYVPIQRIKALLDGEDDPKPLPAKKARK